MVEKFAALGFLVLAVNAVAADQFGFDTYYDAAKIGTQSPSAETAITRQSSCTIQLKTFAFSEVQNGNYVPQLLISFRSALPGGGFDEVSKVSVVFDDVIKTVEKNKPITLRSSNQIIGTGINLSRVTQAHVELRLNKVKDSFADFADVVRPLLNSAQSVQPALGIIDNLLSKVQDGPVAPLLFSADFLVAGNALEYDKLASTFADAFLKGNQDYVILINSTTPIQDSSLRGRVVSLVNAGARAVVGQQVIDPASQNVTGYATIAFTKYRIPLLPPDLENDLRGVQRGLSKTLFDYQSFDVDASRAENTASYLESNKTIDSKTASTIVEYLGLARIYGAYRANNPNAATAWDNQFADWLFNFKIRQSALAAQSAGVRGLYKAVGGKDYIAPLYLLYFLPDDLLLSAQTWQLQMHRALAQKNSVVAAIESVQSAAVAATSTSPNK